MRTSSEKFGLLLAHLFLGDREALSVPGAARLCGLHTGEARALLELLAQEGLLRRGRASRGRSFLAHTGSPGFKLCREAYRRQRSAGTRDSLQGGTCCEKTLSLPRR